MTQGVKVAAIVAGAIIITAALVIYFSPYQSCVRAYKATAVPGTLSEAAGAAAMICSRRSN